MAHYNSDYPNIITTGANTKGLGATIWQEQPNGNLKPIGFAGSFLSDTEKKYAINELELLAVVWGLEHSRSYIYGKPMKLVIDHQALEPLIKRSRSNKTFRAPLTRWLDRLAHFSIIAIIAGKHLALTDYLSRNPSAPPQADEAYDEKFLINNIIPQYSFVTKYGCLSNHFNQSQNETPNKTPHKVKQSKTLEQTAIDCLESTQISRSNSIITKNNSIIQISRSNSIITKKNSIMDARTIDNLEQADPSAETRHLKMERYHKTRDLGTIR